MELGYVGQWWLPEDDTHAVPGELTLSKGEPARLDLQAPLSKGLPGTRLPVVLGTSARGEVLTLTDVSSHGISRTNTRKLDHEVLRDP